MEETSSPMAQQKNLPVMQEMWVRSLSPEDLLEESMATHYSVLVPGESHGPRSLAGHSSWDCKESDMTEVT